jgi:hypothetical protein
MNVATNVILAKPPLYVNVLLVESTELTHQLVPVKMDILKIKVKNVKNVTSNV